MSFDPKSITKAKSRLRIAEKAISDLKAAKDHTEFSDTWYTFLVAYKNVYTSLEQGSKTSAGDRQWFGSKKAERKADPLLQYLFQARDDDEHGLSAVTELDPGGLAIGVNKPGFASGISGNFSMTNGLIDISGLSSTDGNPILVEHRGPHTKLATVTGRGPIQYSPPREHLGKRLADDLPIPVAELAVAYLHTLIEEAEGRA